MIASRPLAVAALLAAAAPLSAQSPAPVPAAPPQLSNVALMANDHYTRSHDYDLIHERIEIGNFSWDSLGFSGRVDITLRALRAGFDSVVLDAGSLLDVRAIHGSGGPRLGSSLRFDHVRDTLVVHLPKAVGFGDTVRFQVEYAGRVTNGEGLTFIEGDTLKPARPRQLWSQGEDHNNHFWFPTYDFPNDKMTWEMVATVPKGYTAVSNGALAQQRVNRDGTRTFAWRQDRPSASYLVSLIVAPLAKISDHWRQVPVDYYVYRSDTALARPLFRVTPDMIDVYSRLTGVSYPWAKYAQTTVADFFGGMENVSATTLVDWLPDARAYVDRPWYRHILIPHELAHQWFGDYVTTANWANMWLNEGFAEFMPGQYWATKLGRAAGEDYYLDEYRQFLRIDQRRRMPLASLGSNNIYPKGALVLEMLRKYLGDGPFWAGVHRYLEQHAYDVATSDDLRQAFLEATGQNLDWFWDQWVYGAGYPEFDVTASYDSTGHSVSLDVKQVQQDTLAADSTGLRYRVAEVFTMPVTIRVGTPSGDRIAHASLADREQTIVVPDVNEPPTMVIFDDGNGILKRLAFEQPTEWLANQLSRDEDLWDRTWVIQQLGGRKSDSLARAALLQASSAGDSYRTRVEALEALAGFQTHEVSTGLVAALKDTSAQVRAAAANALLSQTPTPEALAAIRHTWESDTSYEVRAAALGTLAHLDPSNAEVLYRQAFATPSYQDVVADAALASIVQSNDTLMLDEVGQAAGAVRNAAFALGAFAGRGNARALEMLQHLVYSPRAVVRNGALLAFRFTVPSAVARERLTALLDGAPTPTVRGEIQSTLSKLKE
ncbi:MAG TPA: M1 family aminopeptidase [Gemmatimonadales bacterium]|nr:M1 family aminopeptidase [Gemmatimonadales bacterium]